MNKILPRITSTPSVFSRQSYSISPLTKCPQPRSFRIGVRQSVPVASRSNISHTTSGPRRRPWTIIATASAFAVASATVFATIPTAHADAPPLKDKEEYLRLDEVHKHGREAERRWVTRGNRVYDIEDWIPHHPGMAIRIPLW